MTIPKVGEVQYSDQYYDRKSNDSTCTNENKDVPVGRQPRRKGNPEFDKKLIEAGIPAEIVAKGPQAIEAYAKEHNIKLPPPPQDPNPNE